MFEISSDSIQELRSIVELLRSREQLPEATRWELNHEYRRRALEKMLATGATYGEATGAPGTVSATRDESEFKSQLRAIDDEIAAQAQIVRAGIDAWFEHGEWPAPYYAWRIGIILRKAKQLPLEADFLEAWASHFRNGPGARYVAVADRAAKARSLAAKGR